MVYACTINQMYIDIPKRQIRLIHYLLRIHVKISKWTSLANSESFLHLYISVEGTRIAPNRKWLLIGLWSNGSLIQLLNRRRLKRFTNCKLPRYLLPVIALLAFSFKGRREKKKERYKERNKINTLGIISVIPLGKLNDFPLK